jgi:methionyl-tRNA formyltransferase
VGARAGGAGAQPLRVAFVGNAEWSVPSLEALVASRHDVVRVLTREPRPAGRGRVPAPTPVATAAGALGVALAEVPTIREGVGFESLASAAPDVLVVVAYGDILPVAVLAVPRLLPVNVHFSLLPALRGAAPVQRAILEGVPRTGVTTMRMDVGMDTGPILLQRSTPVGLEEDAGELGARLAAMGGALLVDTLEQVWAGTLEEQPQDEAAATLAPRLTARDEHLDWSRTAEEIARQVRALSPAPGTTTTLGGKRIKVYRVARADPPRPDAMPGELNVTAEGPLVSTGRGALRLDEVQAEGRRRMPGREWARGAHLSQGAVLGA